MNGNKGWFRCKVRTENQGTQVFLRGGSEEKLGGGGRGPEASGHQHLGALWPRNLGKAVIKVKCEVQDTGAAPQVIPGKTGSRPHGWEAD